jgi:hypothetical protein
MAQDLIYLNGINGATGGYLSDPFTEQELARLAVEEIGDPELQAALEKKEQDRQKKLDVKWNINRDDLSQAGWGVIFARSADPQVREALSELLNWRFKQANAKKKLYKEYSGALGYQPTETKLDFLSRHGAMPGPVDPEQVPYYLLIVGDPKQIPYSFQYQLDVAYAVGRIHFDTLEEYARYARSVVEAEKGNVKLARRAGFYAVKNANDAATDLSSRLLVAPLVSKLTPALQDWSLSSKVGADANKANLLGALGGKETPAFLFTASHGMGLPNNDPRQREHQGALIAQDYPGPKEWRKPLTQDFYVAGDDLAGDANPLGMIAFHFACYGAGAPNVNDFPTQKMKAELVPDQPFIARLPQRLLGHPSGGALAVIGHVERAWSYSFSWNALKEQTAVFESAIGRLLTGSPVGAAMEFFGGRAAELANDLGVMRGEINAKTKTPDTPQLGYLWTASNDARSYVIIGDPAARLSLTEEGQEQDVRPAIELSTITVAPASGVAPAAAAAVGVGPGAEFGLTDDLYGAMENLRLALQNFANKVGDILNRTVDEVTRVEVVTYVSDDIKSVQFDRAKGELTGNLERRAITSMHIDGDTLVCVPRRTSDVDEQLWNVHSATVTHAQAYRTELMKAAVEAAAGLLNALKPTG